MEVEVGQFRQHEDGQIYEVTGVSEKAQTCSILYTYPNGDFQERYNVELRYVEQDKLLRVRKEHNPDDPKPHRETGTKVSKMVDPKTPTGRKDDGEKPDFTLLPLYALDGTVRVLDYGARKYARDNWQIVPDGYRRYLAATLRHLAAELECRGSVDPESGLPHLDHAICSLLFAGARRDDE